MYVNCQPGEDCTYKVKKEKSGGQDKEVHQHLGGSMKKGPWKRRKKQWPNKATEEEHPGEASVQECQIPEEDSER